MIAKLDISLDYIVILKRHVYVIDFNFELCF